ncbi:MULTISPECIES: shufflon system plasmid conjugative transfer pilus tip adhesin PilV [Enterobacteriaceae]|uniref:shufflon system plasmid conjugative transfer pilus tip adhesin PilV n=1 Tax=Enterobacteriaceae TaxID=543 RepID=UPI000DEBA941|nr:shufflon system plasmid conjugative transfer pilus tip adhesin PilV [Escherichia coli]MCV9347178.1 shufflon system plasmid conjugative transfer pilus tip adhesin PilV [Escherichia coli]MCX1018702.1 shufflon system plasmid conjugative transfer pilus tip adhesin PilV [Escherichia coli]MDN0421527.1 shufflon system plasmid conjugative transfer pilus tip adhesin PilV [Escherichia coli]MDN0468609.1 shufflon system plasmid conjugative transfer pilus tip adhesin PilV [Escherichia coli]MDN1326345.1 
MKKFRHDDDKGFILLEILAGLIVIGIATPMIYSEIEDWLNEQLYQSAALHADEYNNAIKNYVADKTSSLSSKTITVNELIQQGYLNNGFSRSPFGHSYITGIRKNNLSGRLEALTCTTGGQDIKEDGLRRIAGQINGLGGFMLQNNSVTGAFGGWTDLGSNYQITCNKGHIAMRMAGKDLEESDRLYRYSVQGRPDLNRMHTGIDMNNNSITNINEASGKNARFSGDVTSNRWLHPNGGGFTMTDSQWIRAVNNKGITTEGELKGGKVSGGTVRSEGRLSTGEYLQLDKTATAGTSCSPDGLVGRDSTGAILSCQSGTWQKNGGGTVQMVTATASDWNQPIATATCPSGKKVTGGGGMCSFSNSILKRSSPSGNSAWVAGCSQNTNQNQYYSVTTYALCQ